MALRLAPHPIPAPDLLALITRLKQICNFEPEGDESCKLDALQVLLESAAAMGTKVLLFSQYVDDALNRLSQSIRRDADVRFIPASGPPRNAMRC